MIKTKNNTYYYTVDDILAIANGAAMGIYKAGAKMYHEKNKISVMLSRLVKAEKLAGNLDNEEKKPLLLKNGPLQTGRPKYAYPAYYVDKILNLLPRTDPDNLIISFTTKEVIEGDTLTKSVVKEIFNNILHKNNQLPDSDSDLEDDIVRSIYRKDLLRRNKIITELEKMKVYRENNYNSLEKYLSKVRKMMNSTYEYLQNDKINNLKKLNNLRNLTSLINPPFDEKQFNKLESKILDLINKQTLDADDINKSFKKKKLVLPYEKKQIIISEVMNKNLENREETKRKVKQFTAESIKLISEKQGQIDMLFSYLDTISDFINSDNIDLAGKLELSRQQLWLWKH
jgi:hypothetical protein